MSDFTGTPIVELAPSSLTICNSTEGRANEYAFIEKLHQSAKQQQLTTMIGIEKMIISETLKDL